MSAGPHPDVAVVGAGIVGVSCALHLQRLGKSVVLVDRDAPGEGASFGNAGVLAQCSVVPVATPGILFRAPAMLFGADGPMFLRWSYLPRLLPWLLPYLRASRLSQVEHIARHLAPLIGDSVEQHQALARGTRAERWIRPSPYIFLYADRRAYEGDALAWRLRREQGFEWEVLEGDEIRALDPVLSPDYRCAVVLRNHGFIANPGQYVKDLAEAFVAGGGALRRAEVRDIEARDDGVVLKVAEGDIAADQVVLATGAWSGGFARRFGVTVPLESERGYHVDLADPSVRPAAPVMDVKRKFVATPMDAGLRLAGLFELGGLDAPPSDAPVELLLRGAKAMLPGLAYGTKRTWLGHRPATSDSLPVIGRSPLFRNVVFAYGHHHVGLTAGPKTGRLVAQQVAGDHPNLELEAYRPDRGG